MKEFKDINQGLDKNIDRNDDLSRLFRDSAESLQGNPSHKAWDRLEHKLESRKLRKRAVVYRYTSMAAAAIGLIGIIMVFQLLEKVGTLNETTAQETPIAQLEEQALTEDERKIAEAIQQHRQEQEALNSELDTKLENLDEAPTSKPQPKTNQKSKTNAINDIEPKANKLSPSPSPALKIEAPKKEAENLKRKQKAPVAANPQTSAEALTEVVAEDITIEKADEESEISKPRLASKDEKNRDNADLSEKEKEDFVVLEETYNKNNSYNIEPTNSNISKEKMTNASGNPKARTKKSTNENNEIESKAYTSSSINQLKWIVGNWKDALGVESYENWYITDNQIIGEGYTLIDNKKQFTEYMKIYQNGNDVFLETSVDKSKKFKKFKLKSYDNSQAIFERNTKRFPNQIVIKRVSDAAYTMIYKDKNSKDLNDSQAKYFNQRNNISTRRASRSMNKY